MSSHVPPAAAGFSTIDISPAVVLESRATPAAGNREDLAALLRRVVELQEQQLEITHASAKAAEEARKRRQAEIEGWQRKNKHLVESCREALGVLEGVQRAFLEQMSDYVLENREALTDGEFLLSEFVDRFGPRMAHLSGVMTMLSQLVTATPPPEQQ